MDDKKESGCELCNVAYRNEKTKLDHLHGKKHLLAVHQLNSAKVKEELGIYVTGINKNTEEEVLEAFGTYGKVTESFFGETNHFCIIQFDNPKPVEQLIKLGQIKIKDSTIKIQKRTVKERAAVQATYTAATIENAIDINNGLKRFPTFNLQLQWLIGQIQPSFNEVRYKLDDLIRDLYRALSEEFPECRVHVFGSTVTNLSMINSDIDIYVEVFNNLRNKSYASFCVNRARNVFQKYGRIFTNLCAIPHAKTPIVKFVHVPTNLKCDINFKNLLGVLNSQLIHYYLLINHKLTPMMIFLKYWAKSHDLIGLGGKFSNYTLALMFIFYLQQEVYRLPSVAVLQTISSCNIQDGWNGGFQRTPTNSKVLEEHTMVKVLCGFFEYYSNFDYTLHVICPYLGKTILKTDFVKPEELHDLMYFYKKNIREGAPAIKIDHPLCVQDAFELNHNVAAGVNADYLAEFTALCKVAATILRTSHQDAMYKLLTEEAEVFERKWVVNENECRFKIALGNTLLQINEILTLRKVASNDLQSETMRVWQEELKSLSLKVLREIMRFDVIVDEERKPDEKTQRRIGQKDIHDKTYSSFNCSGYYNLWDGHKTLAKNINLDLSTSLIDQQFAISKYIVDVLYKGSVLKKKIIQFVVNINFTEKPAEANFVLLNKRSTTGYFRNFGLYFLKILPLLFKAHLVNLIKSLNDEVQIVAETDAVST